MNAVKEIAYAKINLYLDVISKREDGFHDIKTVMHSVSLADEITVSVAPSSKLNIRLITDGERGVPAYLPTDDNNIAVKAARAFMDAACLTANINLKLKKNIPIAAGLAGGSADAAAVLRALNKLFRKPFTEKKLMEIAAGIGSDVPFCLMGKTALCEGRGERLTKIDISLGMHFVIANSGEYVSTPTAYALLDKEFSDFKESRDDSEGRYARFYSELKDGSDISNLLYNIFEAPILEKCSGAAKIKKMLESYGALGVMLSGSGPSVFAIFENGQAAKDAAEKVRSEGYFAEYAVSCDLLK